MFAVLHTVCIEPLEDRRLFSAYWLSPSGSDANPGTQSAPWKTLQKAAASLTAGDSLTLRAGTYAGGVTFSQPNLTLQSAPGEHPSISVPTTNKNILFALRLDATASGSSLLGLDLSGGYYYALKLEDTSVTSGASNILIDSCKLHDSGSDIVKITPGCDHVTIRNCEIYNSGKRDRSNAEGVDNVNADYMLLQDSYIHDIVNNGVFAKGGSIGSIIERNRFDRIAYGGILLGQDTDTQWFDTAVNPKLYESIDCVARNNLITNCGGAGVAAYAALRPAIYNNTLLNVAQSMQAGLLIAGVNHKGNRPSENVTILNNIVTVSSSRPLVDIRSGGLTGTLAINNNRYYNAKGPAVFWDENVKSYNYTFSQWKIHIAGDSASSEGDPKVDSTGHLLATSPCIDAGQTLPSILDDLDGDPRPQGSAYDIGADEFSN